MRKSSVEDEDEDEDEVEKVIWDESSAEVWVSIEGKVMTFGSPSASAPTAKMAVAMTHLLAKARASGRPMTVSTTLGGSTTLGRW
jgi:hypothetical protein